MYAQVDRLVRGDKRRLAVGTCAVGLYLQRGFRAQRPTAGQRDQWDGLLACDVQGAAGGTDATGKALKLLQDVIDLGKLPRHERTMR